MDLSQDGYRLELGQILGSVGHLEHLKTLKLPMDVLRTTSHHDFASYNWPRTMKHLQISLKMCSYWIEWSWEALFNSWPTTLQSLSITECQDYGVFKKLTGIANSIQFLLIGPASDEICELALHHVLSGFPALKRLTLPGVVRLESGFEIPVGTVEDDTDDLLIPPGFNIIEQQSLVDILTFTPPVTFFLSNSLGMNGEILTAWVKKFPVLRKVNIPTELLPSDGISNLTKTLERRVPEDQSHTAGIFVYDNKPAK